MSPKARLVFAFSILLVGLLVLFRSYLASRPPAIREEHKPPVSQTVTELLSPSRFEVAPTIETMLSILEQVRVSVVKKAKLVARIEQAGNESVNDLASAFVERLRVITVPDFERDYASAVARGDPQTYDEALYSYEQMMRFRMGGKIPEMSPSNIDVVLVTRTTDGKDEVVRRSRFDQGFGITTGIRSENKFPLPNDPVIAGFLTVEIMMPMMQRDVITKEMVTAIVGYHFAWHKGMQKWIPYQSIIFMNPDSVFMPPPI